MCKNTHKATLLPILIALFLSLSLGGQALAATLQSVVREYYPRGELKKETWPDGRTIDYLEYDANGNLKAKRETLTTNQAAVTSRTTQYEYDALNRLKKTTHLKPTVNEQDQVISQTYDARDNVLTVTDPRHLTTRYEYNGFDELIKQTSPDTGVTTLDMKTVPGLQSSRTDARNKIVNTTYDGIGRPLQQIEGGETVTWTWDTAVNGKGQLHKLVRTRGTVLTLTQTFGYDSLGRLASMAQNVTSTSPAATVTRTVRYGYDSIGRLSTVTYPSGGIATYSYNTTRPDQVASVSWTNTAGTVTPLVSTIQWRPFGDVASWTWGNGLAHTRSYDQNGRINVISHGTVYRKDVDWDLGERISRITDLNTATATQAFEHDWLDRLKRSTHDGKVEEYGYDINGNRISSRWDSSTSTYSYSTTSNRLSTISGSRTASYTYDAAGNTRTDGSFNYHYNDSGRLWRVKDATNTTTLKSYYYNGQGERIVKTDDVSNHVLYVYDTAGHIVGEYGYSSSGNSMQEHIWLGDTPIGHVRSSTGTPYYVLTDHLNTPRRLLHPTTSAVVWQWNGEPFGADTATGSLTYNLRFPGQYYDAETRKHYNYFRDYDPQTGRYIQSDPIGLAGGVNTYGYVGGNPVSLSDVYGLFPGGKESSDEASPDSCAKDKPDGCKPPKRPSNRALIAYMLCRLLSKTVDE